VSALTSQIGLLSGRRRYQLVAVQCSSGAARIAVRNTWAKVVTIGKGRYGRKERTAFQVWLGIGEETGLDGI
jgi:hypothetical protein